MRLHSFAATAITSFALLAAAGAGALTISPESRQIGETSHESFGASTPAGLEPSPSRTLALDIIAGVPAAGLPPATAVPEPSGFILYAGGLILAWRAMRDAAAADGRGPRPT